MAAARPKLRAEARAAIRPSAVMAAAPRQGRLFPGAMAAPAQPAWACPSRERVSHLAVDPAGRSWRQEVVPAVPLGSAISSLLAAAPGQFAGLAAMAAARPKLRAEARAAIRPPAVMAVAPSAPRQGRLFPGAMAVPAQPAWACPSRERVSHLAVDPAGRSWRQEVAPAVPAISSRPAAAPGQEALPASPWEAPLAAGEPPLGAAEVGPLVADPSPVPSGAPARASSFPARSAAAQPFRAMLARELDNTGAIRRLRYCGHRQRNTQRYACEDADWAKGHSSISSAVHAHQRRLAVAEMPWID